MSPSFGQSAWDEWKVVESYVDYGNEMMDKINEFMKRQAEIELEYSKAIQKLVKQQKDDILKKSQEKAAFKSGTVHQSWKHLLDKTESIAAQHATISEQLDTSLRKSIKYRAKDNHKNAKQRFDEIRKAVSDLNKSYDNLEKIKLKHEKNIKDVQGAKSAFDTLSKDQTASKKDVDKLRVDFEKKTALAQSHMDEYTQAIEDVNQKKDQHFKVFLPTQLDLIQKEDEELRGSFVKSALKKYSEIISKVQPAVFDAVKSMESQFEQISPSHDSEVFAKLVRTHEGIPSDYQLFESSELDQERRKILQGQHRPKEERELLDERLVGMLPKEGRKKATERLKQYEREIAELDKKKSALDHMAHVSREKPELYKQTSPGKGLESYAKDLAQKYDTLELKKHKILLYIAACDGIPPPSLPSHLVGKTLETSLSPLSIAASPAVRAALLPSPEVTTANTLSNEAQSVWEDASQDSLSVTLALKPSELNRLPTHASMMPVLCSAIVLYDFEATPNSQEMSVLSGSKLDIIEKQEDGWWRAVLEDPRTGEKRSGYVPANYCDLLGEEEEE